MNKNEIISELKNGNQRFINDARIYPHQSLQYLQKLAKDGQNPMAVIVCCSDSRVNPIICFDRGAGDFFIVRSAGNVLDSHAIDSIKYAVDNLAVPVILVLGHTKCGAVTSAVENHSDDHSGCSVTETIKPSVIQAAGQIGCSIENTTRNNTANMVGLLNNAEFKNHVNIISGLYDIDTGTVEFYK